MKINSILPIYQNNVAFGAMKKSQFNPIDLSCVNLYKAPIEKFNSTQDFYTWADERTQKILSSQRLKTPCDTDKVFAPKLRIINDWTNALLKENKGKYSPALVYMILDSMFKNLEFDKGELPFEYEQDILDMTIDEMEANLAKNPREVFNFSKLYYKNLKAKYINEEKQKQGYDISYDRPFWVTIPAKCHDAEHFRENVKKLKAMSSPNWCTRLDFKAEGALEDDDFFICVKGDEAKIGIRSIEDGVFDVQGKLNDFYFPFKYVAIVDEKIEEEGLKISTQSQFPRYENIAKRTKDIWEEIPEAIIKRDYYKILDYLGYEPELLESGLYSIKNFYGCPAFMKYFKKFGYSEEDFLSQIQIIRGDAYFRDNEAKDTGNIEYIGGKASFYEGGIEKLNKIKKIGKGCTIYNSKVSDLGELEEIGGGLTVSNSPLYNLGKLKRINGYAAIDDRLLPYAEQLEYVENRDFLNERLQKLKDAQG